MTPELEKEFDEITTGRDRMCDEFTRKDIKNFIDKHFIARSEVEKMIEKAKGAITSNNPDNQWLIGYCYALDNLLSTLKKRINET